MDKPFTFCVTIMITFLTTLVILAPLIKSAHNTPWPSSAETWFLGVIVGFGLTAIWVIAIVKLWMEEEE